MSRPIKEFDHVRIKAFGIEGCVVDIESGPPERLMVQVELLENELSEEAAVKADFLKDSDLALFDCDRVELELIEPDEEGS